MSADAAPLTPGDHERLLEIIDVVIGIAANDCSRRARVGDGHDLLDGLAAGVNMLAEEVDAQQAREREFQQRMRRTERLAAIGQLAAGVAHEINNPAAFILANLHALDRGLAAADAGPPDALPAALADARAIVQANLLGIERIAGIVRDLKNFARLEDHDVESVAIDDVVNEACRLVKAELAYRARLTVVNAAGVQVNGSRARLAQVLTNLLFNAAQAIAEGQPDLNHVTVTTTVRDGVVVTAVRDTGHGVSAEARAHLFEPFFTTKPRDRGTGLGLAISADIARQHGGELALESTSEGGSTFTLTLPVASGVDLAAARRSAADTAADAAAALTPAMPAADRRRPESAYRPRVLLIDDEPLLLESWTRLFSRDYRLSAVSGGLPAVALLEADADWDVLICDLMMPDLDGAAVYAWVQAHRPRLASRMVFCSGGAFTPRGVAFLDQVSERLLQKPVRPADLRAAVARVLRVQS